MGRGEAVAVADVVQVPELHPVADDPSRPWCQWCGRNTDALEDDSGGGPPAWTCPDSDFGECDQARDDKMPGWAETWYPRLWADGYQTVTRTPWGMLSLWRHPEEARRYGFNNLALSAPEPAVVRTGSPLEYDGPLPEPVGDDFVRREQAAREQVTRWAEQKAREILALSGGDHGGGCSETADSAAPVPTPSPVIDFEAANWHGTLRHAHNRAHTLASPANRAHLISGGAR